jgi:hypothetical protein
MLDHVAAEEIKRSVRDKFNAAEWRLYRSAIWVNCVVYGTAIVLCVMVLALTGEKPPSGPMLAKSTVQAPK